MRILAWYLAVLIFLLCTKNLQAQDLGIRSYKIEELEKKKIVIEDMEREALKSEVEQINKRMDNGDLTKEEADILKRKAAENRARNIENTLVCHA